MNGSPPDMLKTLATNVPLAVVVLLAFWLFIKYLQGEREAQQKELHASREFFRELHDEHMEARRDQMKVAIASVQASEKNVAATERNTTMMETLSTVIRQNIR